MASAVRAEADNRIVGNLPLELTSFVGRRRELADARRLFESSRLLTLTGVGGVGKTRLAIRLAGALQRVFSNGTWLVELGGAVGSGSARRACRRYAGGAAGFVVRSAAGTDRLLHRSESAVGVR